MLELSTASRYVEIEAQHTGMVVVESQARTVIDLIDEFVRSLSIT